MKSVFKIWKYDLGFIHFFYKIEQILYPKLKTTQPTWPYLYSTYPSLIYVYHHDDFILTAGLCHNNWMKQFLKEHSFLHIWLFWKLKNNLMKTPGLKIWIYKCQDPVKWSNKILLHKQVLWIVCSYQSESRKQSLNRKERKASSIGKHNTQLLPIYYFYYLPLLP